MGGGRAGKTEFWAKPVPPKPRRPRAGTAPLPDILLKISRLLLGRTPLLPGLVRNTCLTNNLYSNWLKKARNFAGPDLAEVVLAPACGLPFRRRRSQLLAPEYFSLIRRATFTRLMSTGASPRGPLTSSSGSGMAKRVGPGGIDPGGQAPQNFLLF